MGKGVWLIAGVLALALLVYVGYNRYDGKRAGSSGDVYTDDKGRPVTRDSSQVAEDRSQAAERVVYPSAPAGQSTQPAAPADGTGQITQAMEPAPAHAPDGDTISPNPPNGQLFGGSGRYQLYRQGNLTWRLDSETGKTCIIFATNEEWKKPQVYRAGCTTH